MEGKYDGGWSGWEQQSISYDVIAGRINITDPDGFRARCRDDIDLAQAQRFITAVLVTAVMVPEDGEIQYLQRNAGGIVDIHGEGCSSDILLSMSDEIAI